ncbi:unnamed protein product [Urochloa decumbens]|uniref:Protein FAR1-RELATED SEQUENCE n=1 Tax=Urochloa decumbens TaxID=240449 RepID=A0ABC9AJT1_9POAL
MGCRKLLFQEAGPSRASADRPSPARQHMHDMSADVEEQIPPQTHKESMEHDLIPKVGMSFHSTAEAKEFFKTYAELAGFGVKLRNWKKFSRVMRCRCYGKGKYFKGDEALRVRNNTTKKTKCNAHLKFTRTYDSEGNEGDMFIEKADLFHNHLLLTHSKTQQMPSHKSKDPELYGIIDELQAAGVSTQSIKNVLRNMHGGPELVPITARDIENRKAANVRAEHADDINKLIEFFKECEAHNLQFRWEPKLDSEGVIHSLFWSHASMQGDYADFGDAMSFDTTHKTNVYEKPLALFVGSNHHLQNSLFGCALLGDETAETFEWVFKAFKKCMGGNKTRCILTDQDQAMAVAIEKEFPGVVHKICRWHLVNKHMPQLINLFGMYANKNFKEKFNSVLNHPLTPKEFEAAWQELLDEFELDKDSTLESLHNQRELFIPAYFKDVYCGRMASTQRSESSNFVMKNCYVDKHTALHRFAKKTLDFVHSRKMKESQETYQGTSKRLTKSKWPFEIQVSRIYTRKVFADFEKKMFDCTAFDIEDDPMEGGNCYLVTHTNRSSKISWGQHQFKVRANKENGDFHCECREWQHTGLFCVHLLRAFIRIQLKQIPGEYILRRYTKYAQQELAFERNDRQLIGADGITQMKRMKGLQALAMAAARSGSLSAAATIRTTEVLMKLDKDNKEVPPDIGPRASGGNKETPREEVHELSDSDEGSDENAMDQDSAEQQCRNVEQARAQSPVDVNEDRERVKGKRVLASGKEEYRGGDVCNVIGRTIRSNMTNEGDGGDHGVQVNAINDRIISRVPPPRAKTKGRIIPESEKQQVSLGAKGEKKGTRKCGKCGYCATHNARTCLQHHHNRERLEAMKNRTRGRTPGAQNKRNANQHDSVGEDQNIRPATRHKEVPTNLYFESESNDEQYDDSDTSE